MGCTIEIACFPLSRHLKTEKVRGGQGILYSWVGSFVTAVVSKTEQRTRPIVRRVLLRHVALGRAGYYVP